MPPSQRKITRATYTNIRLTTRQLQHARSLIDQTLDPDLIAYLYRVTPETLADQLEEHSRVSLGVTRAGTLRV